MTLVADVTRVLEANPHHGKDGKFSSTGGGAKALHPDQKAAVTTYSGASGTRINADLRGYKLPQSNKVASPEERSKAVPHIDAAIAQHGDHSLSKSPLYRGVDVRDTFGSDDLSKINIGTRFIDKGFVSTGQSLENIHGRFATGGTKSVYDAQGKRTGERPFTAALVKLHTSDDSIHGLQLKSLSKHPGEKETLLPRGLTFTVSSISHIPGYFSGTTPLISLEVSRG